MSLGHLAVAAGSINLLRQMSRERFNFHDTDAGGRSVCRKENQEMFCF